MPAEASSLKSSDPGVTAALSRKQCLWLGLQTSAHVMGRVTESSGGIQRPLHTEKIDPVLEKKTKRKGFSITTHSAHSVCGEVNWS